MAFLEQPGAGVGRAHVVRGSPLALLVELEEVGVQLWIPRSVIHENSEVFEESGPASEGELVVLEWWAEKNNLI